MPKALLTLLFLSLATLASAQVTIPYTFTATTTIKSAEVNANFNQLGTSSLNLTGGVMTGTLTTKAIAAGTDNAYDLGASGTKFRSAFFAGTITAANLTLNLSGAAVGDLLYLGSSAATTNLADVAVGSVLISGGTGAAPSWGLISGLGISATNITTGILPVAQLPITVALLNTANVFAARNDFLNYTETKTVVTPGATPAIDLSLGSHFTYANSTTPTFSFTNPPASGKAGSFTLAITGNGTGHIPVWPASVKWASAAAPTVTTTNAKTDLFTFLTYDGGTTWFGFIAGQNF